MLILTLIRNLVSVVSDPNALSPGLQSSNTHWLAQQMWNCIYFEGPSLPTIDIRDWNRVGNMSEILQGRHWVTFYFRKVEICVRLRSLMSMKEKTKSPQYNMNMLGGWGNQQ